MKSSTCLSLLLAQKQQGNPEQRALKEFADTTISTIIRRNSDKLPPNAAIPEGRFGVISGKAKGNITQALGRLRGIEEFNNQKKELNSGKSRPWGKLEFQKENEALTFTKYVAVEGKTEILEFLGTLESNAQIFSDQFYARAIDDYKAISLINFAFLTVLVNWHAVAEQAALAIPTIAFFQILWKQDFWLARPFHSDFNLKKDIDFLKKQINSMQTRDWALVSRNYSLINSVTDSVYYGGSSPELFEQINISQGLVESLPIRDRILLALSNLSHVVKSSWIGVDFILHRNEQNKEPLLMVVIRGSRQVPKMPKRAHKPVSDESKEIGLEPLQEPI